MVELPPAKWRLGGWLVVAVYALVEKDILLEQSVIDVVYLSIDLVWVCSRPRISDF